MVKELYFKWLVSLVCDDFHEKYFSKIMRDLFETEFVWSIPIDENRALDGIDLRVRFADLNEIPLSDDYYPLDGPCSLLEAMVGLALRCEEDIMVDLDYGDRTSVWFWEMMSSLGLDSMDDARFDSKKVLKIYEKLFTRSYRRDGKGGLFTVLGCKNDLREVEIWYQMLWFLNQYIKNE